MRAWQRIEKKGWVRRRLEDAIRSAFMKAYQTIKVDPDKYLEHLRMAYDLPALTYDGVYSVDPEILDHIAGQTIRASMRIAAAEGAGLGMGGMFTMFPDLGILAAITLRMLQKLSLIYGFPYNTEEEEAELWIAAASAAGVDISRELAGEAVRLEVCAAGDSAHRRPGQRRDRGEVDGAADSGHQFGDRRGTELLLRESLGRTRHRTLSPEASASSAAAGQQDHGRGHAVALAVVHSYCAIASWMTGDGVSAPNWPSHFAITTVARQLPSTFTAVRAMSSN